MHGHLTLDQICGPLPVPEFRDCNRCGIRLGVRRVEPSCTDCMGSDTYHGQPRQNGNGGFPPIDPAYEVSVHYPKRPYQCPTLKTLDALNIPYFVYTDKNDAIEVDWARNLFSTAYQPHIEWPIVLISAHGQYVEHWTGYNPQALSDIPAAREAAINSTQPAMSRVPDRELVAA